MRIFFHSGNIHFEDFGGKNFVIPNESKGEIVLVTLQAVIAAQHSVQRTGWVCGGCQTRNRDDRSVCGYCGEPRR